MHIMCLILAKTHRRIREFISERLNEGDWDYFDIGGRYGNIIPVSQKCKNYCAADVGNGMWIQPYVYAPLPGIKYVNVTRCRNIQHNECSRMLTTNAPSIYKPHELIIERPDGQMYSIQNNDNHPINTNEIIALLGEPRHQSYFVYIIDYHI